MFSSNKIKAALAKQAQKPPRNIVILLVNDEPHTQSTLKMQIEDAFLTVKALTTSSVEKAQEILAARCMCLRTIIKPDYWGLFYAVNGLVLWLYDDFGCRRLELFVK